VTSKIRSAGLLFLLLLGGAWHSPVLAQTAQVGGAAPIEVTADQGIEWLRDQKLYRAKGNVVATRGDLTVHAQSLVAYYRGDGGSADDIYKIEALGGVVIEMPGRTASGDKGVYLLDSGTMTLTGGDLAFKTETETVTASKSLEYYQPKGEQPYAVARGDAVAVRAATNETLKGQVITAHFGPGKDGQQEVETLAADGDVQVETKDVFALANQADYDTRSRLATLDGDVRITQAGNQFNGARAEINLETGVSRLLAGKSGRVKGLLTGGAPSRGSGN